MLVTARRLPDHRLPLDPEDREHRDLRPPCCLVLICIGVSAAFMFLFVLEVAPGRNRAGRPAAGRARRRRTRHARSILQRRAARSRPRSSRPSCRRFGEAIQERSGTLERDPPAAHPGGLSQRVRRAAVSGFPGRSSRPRWASASLLLLPSLGMSPPSRLIMDDLFRGDGVRASLVIVGMRGSEAPAEGNAEGAAGRAGHAGRQRRGGAGPQPGAGPGSRRDLPAQPGAERAAGAGEPGDPRRHRARGGPAQPGRAHRARRTSARSSAC